MLVLGVDCSYSISVNDFGGGNCRGDCILYLDFMNELKYTLWTSAFLDESGEEMVGAVDVEPVLFFLQDESFGRLPSYPEYSEIFLSSTWVKLGPHLEFFLDEDDEEMQAAPSLLF